jgi:hypothetical protein
MASGWGTTVDRYKAVSKSGRGTVDFRVDDDDDIEGSVRHVLTGRQKDAFQ